MKYISVCSGIEAASVAWHPLGFEAVAFSEIDKFPCAALAHHYPGVPNYGDMTKFKEWPDATVDILVGGTPCQSFSVAGLRKGLDDPRGNLTLTYLAIAAKYRPKWLVWENVPGILSDKSRAFGAFLGGLGQLGYGFAYRVLDAQFCGVPQRRRRVFVVGHFGDWRRAAAVLFERHSLQGHPAPSREKREGAPRATEARTFECGGIGSYSSSPLLKTGADLGNGCEALIAHSLRAEGFDASEDGTGRGTPLVPVAFDLRNVMSVTNRSNPQPGDPCHTLHKPADSILAFSSKDHGADAGETSPTLRAMGHAGSHANAGGQVAVAYAFSENQRAETHLHDTTQALNSGGGKPGQGYPAIAIQAGALKTNPDHGPDGVGVRTDDVAYTVEARSEVQAVAFESRFVRNGRGSPSDIVPPLKAQSGESGKGDAAPLVCFEPRYYTRDNKTGGAPSETATLTRDSKAGDSTPHICFQSSQSGIREVEAHATLDGNNGSRRHNGVVQAMQVRRLTPRECERLQGFPDDYTLIPYNGKPAKDGPRYKALGNSMAVPVMRWIGERIQSVDRA